MNECIKYCKVCGNVLNHNYTNCRTCDYKYDSSDQRTYSDSPKFCLINMLIIYRVVIVISIIGIVVVSIVYYFIRTDVVFGIGQVFAMSAGLAYAWYRHDLKLVRKSSKYFT